MDYRFVGLGLLTGIVSGLFGIGGGIIMVPFMMYVMNVPFKTATGTSLVAMVLPVGILGVWQYYRAGHINGTNLQWGLALALGLFAGTFLGARLLPFIPAAFLSKAFALVLIYAAAKMWFSH